MSLKEFLSAKRTDQEQGQFAIIQEDKVPRNEVWFVGSGKESAKVSWPYLEITDGLGQMVAETMEFLERKKRITVVALCVNPDFYDTLTHAIAFFCDPDDNPEPTLWEDDESA